MKKLVFPLLIFLSTAAHASLCAKLFGKNSPDSISLYSSGQMSVAQIPRPTFPEKVFVPDYLGEGEFYLNGVEGNRVQERMEKLFPEHSDILSPPLLNPSGSHFFLIESGQPSTGEASRKRPRVLVILDTNLDLVSRTSIPSTARNIVYLSNHFLVEVVKTDQLGEKIIVRKIRDGSEVFTTDGQYPLSSVSIDAGEKVVVLTEKDRVHLFSLENGNRLTDREERIQRNLDLRFRSRQLIEARPRERDLPPGFEQLSRSAISPDGKFLAIGTVVDMSKGLDFKDIPVPKGGFLARTHLFELSTGKKITSLDGVHNYEGRKPDRAALEKQHIGYWKTTTEGEKWFHSSVDWIRFSEDGRMLYVVFFPDNSFAYSPHFYFMQENLGYSRIEWDPPYRPGNDPRDNPIVRVYELGS